MEVNLPKSEENTREKRSARLFPERKDFDLSGARISEAEDGTSSLNEDSASLFAL